MKILADTSGLYAALVRNDVMHADALPTLTALLRSSVHIVTTSYVLSETIALLHARVGPEVARSFDADLRPLLSVTWVDLDLHCRAMEWYSRSGSRSVSLVDCSAFVLGEEEKVSHAFSYDKHFEDEGFRLVRRPADLRALKRRA